MLGNLDRGGTSNLMLWRQRRSLWARKAGLAANSKEYAALIDQLIKVIMVNCSTITLNNKINKATSRKSHIVTLMHSQQESTTPPPFEELASNRIFRMAIYGK